MATHKVMVKVLSILFLFFGLQLAVASENTSSKILSETVNVMRSQYGMAHIEATSLYGLAYGNAYAQAQDHICILADGYLRNRGQRAEYLGPDRQLNDNAHVISDFGYRILDVYGRTQRHYSELSDDTQALAEGFAAGYNHFLAEVNLGHEKLGKECLGASWVMPIDAVDVVAGILSLGIQSSSGRFVPAFVQAHPGEQDEWRPYLVKNMVRNSWEMNLVQTDFSIPEHQQGSNGWALGKEKTKNSRGIVMANPHFPFNGNFRFWANQATVTDRINAMGASIIGFPGPVNIGFNDSLAWTHTFSAAKHAVFYRLSLKPNDKLSYELDGQWQTIESRDIDIQVKIGNGTQTLRKTVFYTDIGIVIEDSKRFPWDDQFVYVLKDANLDSFDSIDHWLAMNEADDLAEFKQTFQDLDGMMFNNTLMADKDGNTFYIDDSNVPLLSSKAITFLKTDPISANTFARSGLIVLPAKERSFIFNAEVEFEHAPQLERNDYVQNSNDSYWLTNALEPLVEHSPLYGKFAVMQSMRTRLSLDMLSNRAGQDGKFTIAEVEHALLDNSTFFSRFKSDLQTACILFAGQVAGNVDAACRAVTLWDGMFNLDSKAAHLINELVYMIDLEADFNVKFDSKDPINTPRDLVKNSDILKRLAVAAELVTSAGFALDAKWGDVQYLQKDARRIRWPGATHHVGGFNIYAASNHMDMTSFSPSVRAGVNNPLTKAPTWSGLNQDGIPVHFGSSWMMVVGFESTGPKARGLLSFSQSTLAGSKHFTDQSLQYSQMQQLVDLPYRREDLAKQLKSKITLKIEKD
ncbi:penicillin acylase family protein [Pseudoalteromonas sp. MMG013]|uniref:penicillin acylase family protein n=1 Tax=Pseudoalteromonas sp. MMG013 TaxID=2822687 RepID=UPI001B380E6D|nr:penicillin acylase family protein [Pseudoalteromonas sp. MMG013]MBQ4862082.1 penicillin acylase family protein [Pseudoalteromonas sp. MMG013]